MKLPFSREHGGNATKNADEDAMPNPERIDTGAADMTLTTSRFHPANPLKTKKALRNAKPNNENGAPFPATVPQFADSSGISVPHLRMEHLHYIFRYTSCQSFNE
jgi:hypothetical protein